MHAAEREKKNVEFHYDLPVRFYELMLGESLGYTCGYYRDPEDSMDTAQYRKMELICQKLRLAEGDRLLDVGCGWGGFMVYAAKRHGARVTGITLSSEQRDYAMAWLTREGLEKRCTVELLNYRHLGERRFDKISCIGMSEHVGIDNMPGFMAALFRTLADGGLFLLHAITNLTEERSKGPDARFMHRYIFPDGEIQFNHTINRFAFEAGFEPLSCENFRPHYVRTLKDWLARMDLHREEMISLVDPAVYRAYSIFWAGSVVSFDRQRLALHQNLFYKKGAAGDRLDLFGSLYPAEL